MSWWVEREDLFHPEQIIVDGCTSATLHSTKYWLTLSLILSSDTSSLFCSSFSKFSLEFSNSSPEKLDRSSFISLTFSSVTCWTIFLIFDLNSSISSCTIFLVSFWSSSLSLLSSLLKMLSKTDVVTNSVRSERKCVSTHQSY